jgi:hypothetical protein
MKDTSIELKILPREEFAVQLDNGGARTVASRAFADHCKAPVMELKTPMKLMTFILISQSQ